MNFLGCGELLAILLGLAAVSYWLGCYVGKWKSDKNMGASMRFLCWLGFHNFKTIKESENGYVRAVLKYFPGYTVIQCEWCGKILVRALNDIEYSIQSVSYLGGSKIVVVLNKGDYRQKVMSVGFTSEEWNQWYGKWEERNREY